MADTKPNKNFPYYCDECGFLRNPSECSGSKDCRLYKLVPVD